MNIHNSTPILVGSGQITEKDVKPTEASSPLEMMCKTSLAAFADAGLDHKQHGKVDYLVVIRGVGNPLRGLPQDFINSASQCGAQQYLSGQSRILPRALSDRLGMNPSQSFTTSVGGNTPQMLVNATAEKIAKGEVELALFSGAEALSTIIKAVKQGVNLNWDIEAKEEAQIYSPEISAFNKMEEVHGMNLPVNTYPLFENALRGHYGWSLEQHRQELGQLFSKFSQVAATHQGAWFPEAKTPEEITTASSTNRLVNFPYTKLLNSMLRVNQSASVLMTSVGKARELGISPDKWIFLHGCGDAHDHWYVSERVNYFTSPAIKQITQNAMKMANTSIENIDYFDLYSCFPSLVQITRDMLGLSQDDPRNLTLTGGLPYHGGAGNNYVMHGIATMMDTLRENPDGSGLVTGNGWYITKHSVGIYSQQPYEGVWSRNNPLEDQNTIDTQPHPEIEDKPEGKGTIETYTVIFDKKGRPSLGIIIGRDKNDRRFVANAPNDLSLLENLVANDPLGISGTLRQDGELNIFSPS